MVALSVIFIAAGLFVSVMDSSCAFLNSVWEKSALETIRPIEKSVQIYSSGEIHLISLKTSDYSITSI